MLTYSIKLNKNKENFRILVLIFSILTNFDCVQNKIFIKEVYLKSENLSEEAKQTLKYKKIEKCYTQKLFWGLGGEFNAIDHYDESLKDALELVLERSSNYPWKNIKILKKDSSCFIIEGYYDEQK